MTPASTSLSYFPRGLFIMSLDFELVWGSRDLMADPAPLMARARVTRQEVFGGLLSMCTELGVTATWATVGHLFLGEARQVGGRLHPEVVPPRHAWHPAPWFEGVPEGTEAEHPEFYARSLVERLRDAGQDVGSHSFSHPIFSDAGCTRESADTDLARCVAAAAALGIRLRSFVFPRNQVGHVDLLGKHGFTCWRGPEPVWYQHPDVPRSINRLIHFMEVANAQEPPTVMPYRDVHGLWCIPASGSFLPIGGPRRVIPLRQRILRACRGIDQAAAARRISHFWLHPINLADDPARLLRAIRRIVEHAARLRDQGRLEIASMAEVAGRCEALSAAAGLPRQGVATSPGEPGRSARS